MNKVIFYLLSFLIFAIHAAYAIDLDVTLDENPKIFRHQSEVILHDAFIHYGAFSGDERTGILIRTDEIDSHGQHKSTLVKWLDIRSLFVEYRENASNDYYSATLTSKSGVSRHVLLVGWFFWGGSTREESHYVLPLDGPATIRPNVTK